MTFDYVLDFCLLFCQVTVKTLDMGHQPHGFLSLTYTQAVTRNVLHKLTARQDRAGPTKLSEGVANGSPQHLHEILLTTQPFDLVLFWPLLASIVDVFHVVPPSPCVRQVKERLSAGQPVRGLGFSSSNLPLIYINTSMIRVFCPLKETQCNSGEFPD